MDLTPRDRRLVASLAAARWLTTTQVAALVFPAISTKVVQRRLRLLRGGCWIESVRANRMADALHTLGRRGREFLMARGWQRPIRLERTPPLRLEHFLGVNDIRVAVERSSQRDRVTLEFFFACWELTEHGWPWRLIPDAACQASLAGESRTALFEYDRGTERPGYLVSHKFRRYAAGFEGLPFSVLVVVVDSDERLFRLRERSGRCIEEAKLSFALRENLLASFSLRDWF
jgi:hypothetical protein